MMHLKANLSISNELQYAAIFDPPVLEHPSEIVLRSSQAAHCSLQNSRQSLQLHLESGRQA